MAPFGLSCEASFWCPMAGSLDTNRSRLPTVACWIWRQASMKVGGVRWWLGKGYCEQKDGDSKHWKINLMGIWLVVWNMTFIFLYIGNVIVPIDFHIFQVYYYSWILQKHKPNIHEVWSFTGRPHPWWSIRATIPEIGFHFEMQSTGIWVVTSWEIWTWPMLFLT